jgi:hypothetical protein
LRTRRIAGNGKQILKDSNWAYDYANWFIVLAEYLDMFRLGAIAADGKMNPSGNLSFTNRTLVE